MFDTLAGMYDSLMGPPGIPWNGLVANGHGISENGYDPAYMDIMLQESFKFFATVGSLGPHFKQRYSEIRNDEAKAAVTRIQALISQTGSDVWQAAKDGDWAATVSLPKDVAEDVLAALAASAANAAFLHFDGVVEGAMRAGKMSPDEVMAHADYIVRTFRTFTDLDKDGHLSEFKANAPVAGIGVIVPVVAWIALGIVAILGICYILNLFFGQGPLQRKLIEWCDQIVKTGTKEDAQACVNAAQNMATKGNPGLGDFLGGILQPLMVVLGVGAALYALSLMAPFIRKAAVA